MQNRTERSPHRDLVVHAGHSVALARVLRTPAADALWERLPIYGNVHRLAATLLGIDVAGTLLSPALADTSAPRAQPGLGTISYCPARGQILIDTRDAGDLSTDHTATTGSAVPQLLILARFTDRVSPGAFDAINHGVRVALLHADS